MARLGTKLQWWGLGGVEGRDAEWGVAIVVVEATGRG